MLRFSGCCIKNSLWYNILLPPGVLGISIPPWINAAPEVLFHNGITLYNKRFWWIAIKKPGYNGLLIIVGLFIAHLQDSYFWQANTTLNEPLPFRMPWCKMLGWFIFAPAEIVTASVYLLRYTPRRPFRWIEESWSSFVSVFSRSFGHKNSIVY